MPRLGASRARLQPACAEGSGRRGRHEAILSCHAALQVLGWCGLAELAAQARATAELRALMEAL